MNLFCFPFAGGGRHSYRGLVEKAPVHVTALPVELPGRGTRVMEPLLTRLDAMVEDIWQQVSGSLDKPYALYGHSMGTLLVYLFAHKVKQLGYPQPAHLFLTGCKAPSRRAHEEIVYNLPREGFYQKVREMGGMADEVLNNDVLMDFFEPILRADFEAVETFRYVSLPPLHTGITVIAGTEEKITDEDMLAWEKETTAPVHTHRMSGKHFFILDHEQELMDMIGRRLQAEIVS